MNDGTLERIMKSAAWKCGKGMGGGPVLLRLRGKAWNKIHSNVRSAAAGKDALAECNPIIKAISDSRYYACSQLLLKYCSMEDASGPGLQLPGWLEKDGGRE